MKNKNNLLQIITELVTFIKTKLKICKYFSNIIKYRENILKYSLICRYHEIKYSEISSKIIICTNMQKTLLLIDSTGYETQIFFLLLCAS